MDKMLKASRSARVTGVSALQEIPGCHPQRHASNLCASGVMPSSSASCAVRHHGCGLAYNVRWTVALRLCSRVTKPVGEVHKVLCIPHYEYNKKTRNSRKVLAGAVEVSGKSGRF